MKAWVIECTSRSKFNFLAKLIMAKQKTNFSHMAIAYFSQDGASVVYHAKWPKPEIVSFDEFFKNYHIVDCYALKDPFLCSSFDLQVMIDRLIRESSHYSITQLIMIYLQIQFSKLKTVFKMTILNHEHGLICSEVIGRYLNKGWGLKFETNYDSIDLVEASQKARSVQDKTVKWQR